MWYLPLRGNVKGAAASALSVKSALRDVPAFGHPESFIKGEASKFFSVKELRDFRGVLLRSVDACAPYHRILEEASISNAADRFEKCAYSVTAMQEQSVSRVPIIKSKAQKPPAL
jgi:hypothetical protein